MDGRGAKYARPPTGFSHAQQAALYYARKRRILRAAPRLATAHANFTGGGRLAATLSVGAVAGTHNIPAAFQGGGIMSPGLTITPTLSLIVPFVGGGTMTVGDIRTPTGTLQLLLHLEGANNSTTITDSSGSGKVVTAVGTAKLSNVKSKFGTTSLRLDGGGYITTPNAAGFNPAGDFTLDFWVNLDNTTADYELFSKINATGHAGFEIYMFHGSAGNGLTPFLENGLSLNGSTSAHDGVCSVGGVGGPVNTWHHVAFVRTGSNYKMAWDGVFSDLFVNAANLNTGTGIVTFGARNDGGVVTLAMVGYLDEIRWVNGAAWTANFTPPVAPYT